MTRAEYNHAVSLLGQPDEFFEDPLLFGKQEDQETYTGEVYQITVPETGIYHCTLRGAAGIMGSNARSSTQVYHGEGGRGAELLCSIPLEKDDVLLIVVGSRGTISRNMASDGAGGGSGGGTWLFRKIAAITDSRYQIAIHDVDGYWECLAVAAGGGGTQDLAYRRTNADADDAGTQVYSLDNFSAASTTTRNPSSSGNANSVLSLTQIATYGFTGTMYTRNSNVSHGGFGCGSVNDDNASAGGGWNGTSTVAQNWALHGGTATVVPEHKGGYFAIALESEYECFAYWAPVFDRTKADCVYGNDKGCLDAKVLTRIESDTDYVFRRARIAGYGSRDLYEMQYWDKEIYPFLGKLLLVVINVLTVEELGFWVDAATHAETPHALEPIPFEMVNEWERVLYEAHQSIPSLEYMYRICGTFSAGNNFHTQIIRRR